MNSEIKNLVIKDISARVSYGVKFACNENVYTAKGLDLIVTDEGNWEYAVTAKDFVAIEIDFIKPYLFPLSSMSEEQCKELEELGLGFYVTCQDIDDDGYMRDEKVFQIIPCTETDDWMNAHHFDYRGLIEKSLAIDCTNLNIY
jgi:hypothetical protein